METYLVEVVESILVEMSTGQLYIRARGSSFKGETLVTSGDLCHP